LTGEIGHHRGMEEQFPDGIADTATLQLGHNFCLTFQEQTCFAIQTDT